ncbi:hypothetical protein [Microcoleus vaginatus]
MTGLTSVLGNNLGESVRSNFGVWGRSVFGFGITPHSNILLKPT